MGGENGTLRYPVTSMKRLLTVKLLRQVCVWECGNPFCGFPHSHTRSSFATRRGHGAVGRSRAAFYSRFR